MKITAIILAAGTGERMCCDCNKAFVKLNKPLLYYSLLPFEQHKEVNNIIIVLHGNDIDECKQLVAKYNITKVSDIIIGGETRQQSSYNGVSAATDSDIIMIHDAARPFVTKDIVTNSISDAEQHGASVVAVQVKDTIKQAEQNTITKTLDRNNLWEIQTPQTFKADLIKQAHEQAKEDNLKATDDAALVEHLGKEVKITQGSYDNIKITTPKDLKFAQHLLGINNAKVGIGQDSHRFSQEPPLVIGGVRIDNHIGFHANSDGDVVLHALCNALCSAIGRGSISDYADDMYAKGITDSREYVKVALGYVEESGYAPNNVSITIEAKTPKIQPLIPNMKSELSKLLKIEEDCIGITATSGEGLTEFGQGKGVQAIASVTLK